MEFLSTTALANELQMKPSDLFEKFKSLGWVEKKNDKWILTETGRKKGGEIRKSPKYGEFIVWPENISLNQGQQSNEKSKYLSATAIGKEFNVSSQRINLILSELGLIEKDVAGWEITKLGKSIGGKQLEHETSGGSYVIWLESILQNKSLLEFFKESSIEAQPELKPSNISISPSQKSTAEYHDTFREKFPALQRTLDGHYVRSKSEMLIDNFLYINGIVHAYERKLPIQEDLYCDFYIPSGRRGPQMYIEFWGLENDPKYLDRKNKKIETYKKYEFPLIELTEPEINNLEEVLTRKLIINKFDLK